MIIKQQDSQPEDEMMSKDIKMITDISVSIYSYCYSLLYDMYQFIKMFMLNY